MIELMQLTGTPGKLATATLISNSFFNDISPELLGDKEFIHFDSANIDLRTFCDLVREMRHLCNPLISTYTPSVFNLVQRNVLGYTAGDYKTIWLNMRNINRDTSSIVGTICHEYVHCLEHEVKRIRPKIYFNHGDNKKKPNTLPYYIGERAITYAESFIGQWIDYNQQEKSIQVIEAEKRLGNLGMNV